MKNIGNSKNDIGIEAGSNFNNEGVLRSEIIESQKSQAEFFKWKLIAVAAIGSIVLGKPLNYSFNYLLCLITFVCAYVDLLSTLLMLRIIVIGTYLKKTKSYFNKSNIIDYESFVSRIREIKNPFSFELLALHGSSIVFNLIICIFGIYQILKTISYKFDNLNNNIILDYNASDIFFNSSYIIIGLIGIAFTFFLKLKFEKNFKNN